MKTLALLGVGALIVSLPPLNISAVPLNGAISISTTPHSSWTGDGGNVNTIASILNFGVSQVDSATGDFVPAIGSVVIWGQPLSFATPAAHNPLWQVTVGPVTFTFDLDAVPLGVNRSDRPFPIPDTLELFGSGVLNATGLDPAPGGWTWSGTMNGGATFSFASTTVDPPSVPDSGAGVTLLGMALGGLALIYRRSN